jgi:hypothetical protein
MKPAAGKTFRTLVVWLVVATGSARPAFAGVGTACAGTCAGAHEGCYEAVCACQPGYVACGASCVDVTRDPSHCGACNQACRPGWTCTAGACKSLAFSYLQPGLTPPASSSAGPPFDVTPGACGEFESRPVLSAESGMVFQADANETVSWASTAAPDIWSVSGSIQASPSQASSPIAYTLTVPPPACMPPAEQALDPGKAAIINDCPAKSGGDVWATTSGFTGEEYVLARTSWDYWMPLMNASQEPLSCTTKADCSDPIKGNPTICAQTGQCTCENLPTSGKACFVHNSAPGGVVLSDDTIEKNGTFPPALWVDDLDVADDGLTFDYDQGGTSLWGAAPCGVPTGHSRNFCAALFEPCAGATVGGAACSQVPFPGVPGNQAILMGPADTGRTREGHDTVVVNPCTHHALVSFIDHDSTSGYVVVEALDHTGGIVGRWQLPVGYPSNDTLCPIAGGSAIANQCTSWPLCPSPNAPSSDTACDKPGPGGTGSAVSRIVLRAPLDVETRDVNGAMTCTLYVGYDESVVESGGNAWDSSFVRHAASLASLDVTPDSTGAESKLATLARVTQVDPRLGESMDGTPEVSRFGDALGFIYVQRDPSGAWEMVRARVTSDDTFSSWTDLPVSGWQSGQRVWLGDNIAQLRGGLPGGQLLATWPNWDKATNCQDIEGSVLDVAPVAKGTHTYVPAPPVPSAADAPAPLGIPSLAPDEE